MTRWVRFRSADNHVGFGTADGEWIAECDGEMFGSPRPSGRRVPLDAVTLLCPCAPTKIVALWNNFHALTAKLGKREPNHPLFLIKPGSSAGGPGDPIQRPL